MSIYNPRERIDHEGDMHPVFERVAADYELGDLHGYVEIPVGYEDYNVVLGTATGRHFVKIFAQTRQHEEIDRFTEIVEAAITHGVNHPRVYEAGDELLYHDNETDLEMVVMEFVEGKTFYDMGRIPNNEELKLIMRQAVLINSVPLDPPFIYDSWALPSLAQEFAGFKTKIPAEDAGLIQLAVDGYMAVDVGSLPTALVHGDLIKSNLLVGENGQIYVFDFSVANTYPRIQELAVIIGNLINDPDSPESFADTVQKVIDMYMDQGGELTVAERQALPAFARAAYAAELLGAHREHIENGVSSPENDYWMHMGRIGLKRSMG